MDVRLAELPVIGGDIDAAYLSAALMRAGREAEVEAVEARPFEDGRSSTPVHSLRSSAGQHVLKVFGYPSWLSAFSGRDCIEAELWASGVTRHLPPPLTCPTIDLAFNADRGEYWMLMDDVSEAITPRGAFEEQKLLWLLDGLAQLHARYWGKADDLPVWSLSQRCDFLVDSTAAAGGRIETTARLATSLEKVGLFRAFMPIFLDALGPGEADFYLDHCARREPWLSALTELPATLSQGDIRRANFAAFSADKVSLFDWDFAVRAPAARDLAWFWFLQFWCYPPKDGKSLEDREPLRAFYRRRLDRALGGTLDKADFERSFALCWLWVFAEIGFILIDPLTGKHGEDDVRRVRTLCRDAVDHAKRIYDAHVR